jgi:hypothetical protein
MACLVPTVVPETEGCRARARARASSQQNVLHTKDPAAASERQQGSGAVPRLYKGVVPYQGGGPRHPQGAWFARLKRLSGFDHDSRPHVSQLCCPPVTGLHLHPTYWRLWRPGIASLASCSCLRWAVRPRQARSPRSWPRCWSSDALSCPC